MNLNLETLTPKEQLELAAALTQATMSSIDLTNAAKPEDRGKFAADTAYNVFGYLLEKFQKNEMPIPFQPYQRVQR